MNGDDTTILPATLDELKDVLKEDVTEFLAKIMYTTRHPEKLALLGNKEMSMMAIRKYREMPDFRASVDITVLTLGKVVENSLRAHIDQLIEAGQSQPH